MKQTRGERPAIHERAFEDHTEGCLVPPPGSPVLSAEILGLKQRQRDGAVGVHHRYDLARSAPDVRPEWDDLGTRPRPPAERGSEYRRVRLAEDVDLEVL